MNRCGTIALHHGPGASRGAQPSQRMTNPYSEDALVERPPSLSATGQGRETANRCSSRRGPDIAPLPAADGFQVVVAPAHDLVQEDADLEHLEDPKPRRFHSAQHTCAHGSLRRRVPGLPRRGSPAARLPARCLSPGCPADIRRSAARASGSRVTRMTPSATSWSSTLPSARGARRARSFCGIVSRPVREILDAVQVAMTTHSISVALGL